MTWCHEKGDAMEDDNKNNIVTPKEENSNTVVTKKDVENMSAGELLGILLEYEGPGRSVRFQENAMTQEKKKQGIPYTYDFSWSWLVDEAEKKDIHYGDDGHWSALRSVALEEKEILYVRNITGKKKRTVEATEEAFKAFDELADDVAVSKALLLTEALERFVHDVRSGAIKFQIKL